MQSHLFATPQILFVGLVDDFSKNPGYSPDVPWDTTGMNYLIKLMETQKKREKGRNTKSFLNLSQTFASSIYYEVNNLGHTKSGQCPYNIVDNNADL